MKSHVRTIIVSASLGLGVLSMSGCQTYTLAPANQPVLVNNSVNITPAIDWSRRTAGEREYWTVDGPALEELALYVDIEDGKPLFVSNTQINQGEDGEMPPFRSTMDALEISELLSESLSRLGVHNLVYTEMTQQTFSGHDGFRFTFTFSTKDGLEKLGFATGTLKDGKLTFAMYTGTKEYYFDKYKDAVERTLASVQFQPV